MSPFDAITHVVRALLAVLGILYALKFALAVGVVTHRLSADASEIERVW